MFRGQSVAKNKSICDCAGERRQKDRSTHLSNSLLMWAKKKTNKKIKKDKNMKINKTIFITTPVCTSFFSLDDLRVRPRTVSSTIICYNSHCILCKFLQACQSPPLDLDAIIMVCYFLNNIVRSAVFPRLKLKQNKTENPKV